MLLINNDLNFKILGKLFKERYVRKNNSLLWKNPTSKRLSIVICYVSARVLVAAAKFICSKILKVFSYLKKMVYFLTLFVLLA